MIRHITLGELYGMTEQEGLILQGCGGDPQEWLDGINGLLAEEGILRNGGQFREASVFEHDGRTNILFPMDNVDLDIGKLAMWRLQTRETFGGYWLSDYLPNRLGVHADDAPRAAENAKPDCALLGQDRNVFNLIGLAARTLRQNGLHDQSKEMTGRAFGSDSYDQALGIITEYVNVTSVEAGMDEDEGEAWRREPEYDDEDWAEEEQGMGGMEGMA